MKKYRIAAALLGAILFSSCTTPPVDYPLISQPEARWSAPELEQITHQAADALLWQFKEKVRTRETILPTSFVEESQLEHTSALGRLLARQMASRFTQAGFSVVEIKLRKDLRLSQGEGQFILSRELEKVSLSQKATTVLVGSYAVSKSRLHVNSQLIRLKDGVSLASQDYTLRLTRDLRALLDS